MFFSRAALIVFKTTGGRAWNPPGGLRPLTPTQRRNRKENVELALKNMSVLKLAAANQPPVPVRLFKPLNHTRLKWMKHRLEAAKKALGWDVRLQAGVAPLQATAGREPSSLLPPVVQAALRQQQQQQ